MAECAYCKTDTELFENGIPICVVCAVVQALDLKHSSVIQLKLLEEISQATDRVNAAAESFRLIMKDIPSNVAGPRWRASHHAGFSGIVHGAGGNAKSASPAQ